MALGEMERFIEDYEFDKASQTLYHFIWDDYCDWYLEISKFSLYGDDNESKKQTLNVLVRVLLRSLRALHPFAPYITEEIFGIFKATGINLPESEGLNSDSILDTDYPVKREAEIFKKQSEEIELVKSVVTGIRNLRAIMVIHPSDKVSVYLNTEDEAVKEILEKKPWNYHWDGLCWRLRYLRRGFSRKGGLGSCFRSRDSYAGRESARLGKRDFQAEKGTGKNFARP